MTRSATAALPGFVKMVVDVPNKPEIVDIDACAGQERNTIMIDNTRIDHSAHQADLNLGARVEVTIRAKAAAIRARESWSGMPNGKQC
jgi:hypothetical protein